MKPGREVGTSPTQTDWASGAAGGAQLSPTWWTSLRAWPALVAIGLVAFVTVDMSSGRDSAPILAACGLVYLGAVALQKPTAAWPLCLVTFVVITADSAGWMDLDATWILLALGGVFLGYALLRGAVRPSGGLSLQTIGMIVFGGAAAIALFVDELFGALIVAAGLLVHAGWDLHHHRVNQVVARSFAEFCFVLDILLAIAIVVVTVRG